MQIVILNEAVNVSHKTTFKVCNSRCGGKFCQGKSNLYRAITSRFYPCHLNMSVLTSKTVFKTIERQTTEHTEANINTLRKVSLREAERRSIPHNPLSPPFVNGDSGEL